MVPIGNDWMIVKLIYNYGLQEVQISWAPTKKSLQFLHPLILKTAENWQGRSKTTVAPLSTKLPRQ